MYFWHEMFLSRVFFSFISDQILKLCDRFLRKSGFFLSMYIRICEWSEVTARHGNCVEFKIEKSIRVSHRVEFVNLFKTFVCMTNSKWTFSRDCLRVGNEVDGFLHSRRDLHARRHHSRSQFRNLFILASVLSLCLYTLYILSKLPT